MPRLVITGLIAVTACAQAPWAPPAARVREAIDETKRVTIERQVHPLARPQFDQGLMPDDTDTGSVFLLLQRSPEQEAAAKKLVDDLHRPGSPVFHQWLTPQEFGWRFGPAQEDVDKLTGWLQSEGFKINNVANGRVYLEFRGTTGQIREAFHTEIHTYSVNGEIHHANNVNPSIPTALAPLVKGFVSLHDFYGESNIRLSNPAAARPQNATSGGIVPPYTLPSHAFTPGDFATIYNLKPLYAAGIDGTGVSIAVVGRSNILVSAVNSFRQTFLLPPNPPDVVNIGSPIGVVTARNDYLEAYLDVEWSGAVAPGAHIIFVTHDPGTLLDGQSASVGYAVDNNIAPIVSESFGYCEDAFFQFGEDSFYASIWQQAVAQGQTPVVSSGDKGPDICNGVPSYLAPGYTRMGRSVNVYASTPYDVSVGGTEFYEGPNNDSVYWGAVNPDWSSALSYIPEEAWNDSFDPPVSAAASGGGPSGNFGVPAFQYALAFLNTNPENYYALSVGRNLPDISLNAASAHDAYVICAPLNASVCQPFQQSLIYQNLPSPFSSEDPFTFRAIGGTSAAAPSFAGIMALVNQKMGGRQGNANYALYSMQALDTPPSCDAFNNPSPDCNFRDTTFGNTDIPGVPGYAAETGYDQATGLGSPNVANIVNNWAVSQTADATWTVQPQQLSFPDTVIGQTSPNLAVGISNTGPVPLPVQFINLIGPDPQDFSTPNNCPPMLPTGASCTISISFQPRGEGLRSATIQVLSGNAFLTINIPVSGKGLGPVLEQNAFTLNFGSIQVGQPSAAQIVTLTNLGTQATLGALQPGGANASDFGLTTTCGSTLASNASCTITVVFMPGAAGSRTGFLPIPGAQGLSFSGNGTQAQAALSLTSLSFGNVIVGALSAEEGAVFSNTGNVPLTFNITAAGPAAADFNVASNCVSPLLPATSCNIKANLQPRATGLRTATVTISNNGPQSLSISLTGTGLPANPIAQLNASSINFGNVQVGHATPNQQVTLTNQGNAPLTIQSMTVTGTNQQDFSLNGICSRQLAINASCTIAVNFDPLATGSRTASVAIVTNGSPSQLALGLNGTGFVPTPQATLSARNVLFGFQQVVPVSVRVVTGFTPDVTQTIAVTNTGTEPLTFPGSAGSISGANAADFSVSGTCIGKAQVTVAQGASCNLIVGFEPSAIGTRSAVLSITDNDPSSPQLIGLSGSGDVPNGSASPAQLQFGPTNVGASSPQQTVTVTNTSHLPLVLTSQAITGSNAALFSFSSNCPVGSATGLVGGATCTYNIQFQPLAQGTFSNASLVIGANIVAGSISIPLTGVTTGARISVATSIAFSSTLVGQSSLVTVGLVNNGNGPLNLPPGAGLITGTNAADFSVGGSCFVDAQGFDIPVTVSPASACNVSVTFKPTAGGARSATLTIGGNALNSPAAILLSGNAVGPIMSSDITSVDLSNGTLGEGHRFTITNSGGGQLTLSPGGATITGSSASAFTLSAGGCYSTAATTLLNGQACNVTVFFVPPDDNENHTATLQLVSTASNSPFLIALSGHRVLPTVTTTNVASSGSPASVLSTVTFTAAVTGAGGTPTGQVTFKDGVTVIGTGTLNSAAITTFATSTLSAGTHSITAVYAGDEHFGSSTSQTLSQVISLLSAAVTVSSNISTAVTGQPVAFTARITGSGPTPTGNVTFEADSGSIQSPQIASVAAAATFTAALTANGSAHSLIATYHGDSNYEAVGSSVFSQTVNPAGTAVALAASSNPAVSGAQVTFTTTVAALAPGAGIPGGSVTFAIDSVSQPAVALTGGVASLAVSTLSAGPHSVAATYSGSAAFASGVAAPLSETINATGSSTALTASASTISEGQSITLTASVTGAGAVPQGTVAFLDGANSLGSSPVVAGGVATVNTTALTAGANTLSATYTSTNGLGSSTSGSVSVLVTVPGTVNTNPTTGQIAVDLLPPAGGLQVFQWKPGSTHKLTAITPLALSSNSRLVWQSWSDGTPSPVDTFTVGKTPVVSVATFATQYLLTVNVNPPLGGSVSGAGYYTAGDTATLTATPAPGYAFANFSGSVAATSSNPLSVQVAGPLLIGANFTPLAPALTASLTGARTDGAAPGTRNVPVTITNSGQGQAYNAKIVSVGPITATSGSGTILVASGVPSAGVTIAPGASATLPLVFNWPSTATRAVITFRLNAMDVTGAISYPVTQAVTVFR